MGCCFGWSYVFIQFYKEQTFKLLCLILLGIIIFILGLFALVLSTERKSVFSNSNIEGVKYGFTRYNYSSRWYCKTPQIESALNFYNPYYQAQQQKSDEKLKEEVSRLESLPGYVKINTENLQEEIDESKKNNLKSLVIEALRSGLEYLPYIQKSATFFKVKEDSDQKMSFLGMSMLEGTKCYLCEENDINSLNVPCMHGGTCKSCAKYNLALSGQCPQCKGIVEKVQVYEIEDVGTDHAKGILPAIFRHFSDMIPISLTQDFQEYQDIDNSEIFNFDAEPFQIDPELGENLPYREPLQDQPELEENLEPQAGQEIRAYSRVSQEI